MSEQFSRTKNSILNLFTGVGGSLLLVVMSFATRTVFIHTLGKAYLGINGLFSDILTMLSLSELGFDTAINFKLYKPLAERDDQRVRILIKFYKQAYRVVGSTILVLGLCLIPALPFLIRDYSSLETLGINATVIFILYLLQSVSSYLFFAYRSAVMKANQKKHILDIADILVTILTNIAQILALLLLRDFVVFTSIVIVFNILKNYVNAVIAKHYYPQFFVKEDEKLSGEEIKGLFKDCAALLAYNINGVVLKATDNIVLSKFLGLSIVGLYSNYLLFYTAIKSFLSKIYTAVKASVGNLFAVGDLSAKYRIFETMNYLTIVLYGTAAVGVSVCANELISVWVGDDYVIAQPFSILIGIEILFHGLKVNLGQIRSVSGAFRQMWYRPLMGIIINLSTSIWLVHVCGIYGVIIGTITADFLTNFMVDPSVIHRYSFENYKPVSVYYKKNLVYIIVLIIVAAVDLWICSHLLVGRGWFSVAFHIFVVAVTVPGVFVLLYWRSKECKYLVGLALRVLHKVQKRIAKA